MQNIYAILMLNKAAAKCHNLSEGNNRFCGKTLLPTGFLKPAVYLKNLPTAAVLYCQPHRTINSPLDFSITDHRPKSVFFIPLFLSVKPLLHLFTRKSVLICAYITSWSFRILQRDLKSDRTVTLGRVFGF